nr:unnamed protein product [Spirometra erinaceieuropaei]
MAESFTLSVTNATLYWNDNCPPSVVPWWVPMAVSGAIYVLITIYLLVRWVYRRCRRIHVSNEDMGLNGIPISLYTNIFGGLSASPALTEDDRLFEIDEECDTASRPWSTVNENQQQEMSMNESTLPVPSTNELYHKLRPTSTFSTIQLTTPSVAVRWKDVGGEATATNTFSSFEPCIVQTQQFPTMLSYADDQDDGSQTGSDTKGVGSTRFSHINYSAWKRYDVKIRVFCEKLTSVSYPMGRAMLTTYVLLCLVSWVVYLFGTIKLFYIESEPDFEESRAGRPPLLIEGICMTTALHVINWVDFVIHIYLAFALALRIGASPDRAATFFKITSVVDVWTIPSALLSVFQNRYHVDLGFLRALNIFNFGEVLSYMGILSSNRLIQKVTIFFSMFAMWMVASGMIHLIIHLGDFWKVDHGALTWNFLDCCYFLLVTMSTVGYGDYSPPRMLGKVFICIFVPVAISIFAVFVPELFRDYSRNTLETDEYQALAGQKHVLVCGHFNNDSLHNVLKGFFHIEHVSRRRTICMVILRVAPFDLAMKSILTRYKAWVNYFQGTPNNPQDLTRVCYRTAHGALVLATPNSSRSKEEDGANIMQAIALKSHSDNIRVLVQLNHFSNKCLLNNFPRWTCLNKDMVICMDELKLGLLAYNCLAPGFSTLFLNLLNGHRMKQPPHKLSRRERWRCDYEYGVSMEIYDVCLSYEFDNLCAQELALFAYEKWNILLLALYCTDPTKPKVILHPASQKDLTIDITTMKAIAIATNSSVVSNLRNFCTSCKAHETGSTCQCPNRIRSVIKAVGEKQRRLSSLNGPGNESQKASDDDESAPQSANPQSNETSPTDRMVPSDGAEEVVAKRDWNERSRSRAPHLSRALTTIVGHSPRFTVKPAVYSGPEARTITLQTPLGDSLLSAPDPYPLPYRPYVRKHIDSTGTFHWVPSTPMSRVKLTPAEAARCRFRDHYLLCIVGPVAGGGLNLRSFVYPLRFYWMEPRDIVILGDLSVVTEAEWEKINNLPNITLVQGSPCSLSNLNAVRLSQCAACTILGESVCTDGDDQCLQDKNTLFCAMTIRSLLRKSPRLVDVTTELHYEKNAHHFSSSESHKLDFKLPLRFQESFARGIVFSNTLLYSSISSMYFSSAILDFFRVLFFGPAVEELESTTALQYGLQCGDSSKTPYAGVKVTITSMNEPPFRSLFQRPSKRPLRYKDVFSRAMTCWRTLCLGLYRLDQRGFRFVFTNPPRNIQVRPDDQVICFMPTDVEWTRHEASEETFGFPASSPGASVICRSNASSFRARSMHEARRNVSQSASVLLQVSAPVASETPL